MSGQEINNPENKYFHIILNMADDDLDVYEYRLLGHYIRVGVTFESVRTTAKKTRMSVGKVVSTRKALEEKGYIRTEEPKDNNSTIKIFVIDRMAENIARYQDRSQNELPVHQMNATCSPDEPKKNTNKKNHKESVDKPQSQASKEQKDKPRDRLFDMIALVCFGLDYKQESNTEAIKLNAARIGMIKSFLLKQNASPEDVWAFKKWWLAKYPDADIPQDRAKFSKHFIAFRTSPKTMSSYVPSQSIASIPEITESDRLEALALIQASKAKKEEIS